MEAFNHFGILFDQTKGTVLNSIFLFLVDRMQMFTLKPSTTRE